MALIADRAERRAEEAAFDNEVWYEALRDVTFPTQFVDLPRSQGEALVALYQHRFNQQDPPTEAHWVGLRALRSALNDAIRSLGGPAFVRLSTRSPKDAVCLLDAAEAAGLRRELAQLPSDGDANELLAHFFHRSNSSLRVSTGHEALKLLACSERVFVDLLTELEAVESAGRAWGMRCCVRRWDGRVRDDFEFRGFVRGGRLVALSQYNTFVHLRHLHDRRAALLAKMERFFSVELEHRLAAAGIKSCVLDLACLEGASDSSVLVVELNPANTATGAAMFSWTEDALLLSTGPDPAAGDPVEFRLMPLPNTVPSADDEFRRRHKRELLEMLLDQAEDTRKQRVQPLELPGDTAQGSCAVC